MGEVIKVILKRQKVGKEEFPWLAPYQDKFAQAAKKAAERLKGTTLTGEAKVREYHRLVREEYLKLLHP